MRGGLSGRFRGKSSGTQFLLSHHFTCIKDQLSNWKESKKHHKLPGETGSLKYVKLYVPRLRGSGTVSMTVSNLQVLE